MNPLFIYFSGEHPYGYGHKYRTGAVLHACHNVGMWTCVISNSSHNIPYSSFGCSIDGALDSIHFMPAYIDALDCYPEIDWVVFDVPMVPDGAILEEARRRGKKIASLHGVGHRDWDMLPDVIWEQDSARNAIIRDDILRYKLRIGKEVVEAERMTDWFVFGGAADVLQMANKFSAIRPADSALLVQTAVSQRVHGTPDIHDLAANHRVTIFGEDRDAYIAAMYHTRKAVLHLGMSCWEMAALGKPIYIFTSNQEHLEDAHRFEQRGLAIAAPEIGFDAEMVNEVLAREFVPTGQRPDGLGAYRFLDFLSKT